MEKINYGIDAPKVIRNQIIIGILLLGIYIVVSLGFLSAIAFLKISFLSSAIFLIIASFLMIAYSRYGKFRHRDRIINLHQWKGNENGLDAGTGLGFRMSGVAKKLDSGKSYGIDIFNSYDL